jgi:hypothetical protein
LIKVFSCIQKLQTVRKRETWPSGNNYHTLARARKTVEGKSYFVRGGAKPFVVNATPSSSGWKL